MVKRLPKEEKREEPPMATGCPHLRSSFGENSKEILSVQVSSCLWPI
jgi:hypothetical protein